MRPALRNAPSICWNNRRRKRLDAVFGRRSSTNGVSGYGRTRPLPSEGPHLNPVHHSRRLPLTVNARTAPPRRLPVPPAPVSHTAPVPMTGERPWNPGLSHDIYKPLVRQVLRKTLWLRHPTLSVGRGVRVRRPRLSGPPAWTASRAVARPRAPHRAGAGQGCRACGRRWSGGSPRCAE